MKIKLHMAIFILIVSSFLAACGGVTSETAEDENVMDEEDVAVEIETLKVYTTIFPLGDFTQKIGGEYVEVKSVIPVGGDAHTFEPTPRAMIEVAEGDLFIYNGAGIEGFADAIINTLANEDILIVKATEGITLRENDHDHGHDSDDHDHAHEHEHKEDDHGHDHDHKEDEHDHGHSHEHKEDEHHDDHAHEEKEDDHGHAHDEEHKEDAHEGHHHDEDPHVWLDPILSISLAENIKDALVSLMPEQKEFFESNFANLKQELEALDEEFQAMMGEVSKDTIIVSHAGYGYWEDRYGIKQIGIAGISPTNEPSQKQLQHIIEYAQDNNIEYILFEQNITSRVSETVQAEVGAEGLLLHNLEGLVQDDIDKEEDYFSLMRRNIEVLRKALQ